MKLNLSQLRKRLWWKRFGTGRTPKELDRIGRHYWHTYQVLYADGQEFCRQRKRRGRRALFNQAASYLLITVEHDGIYEHEYADYYTASWWLRRINAAREQRGVISRSQRRKSHPLQS